MKTILAVLILVCAVVYVLAEIVRNTMLSARRAEYANGVKVDIVSKEELLQKFKGLNSFLIKQVYYNQDGDVEVLGVAGKHAFELKEGMVIPKRRMSFTMGKKYKMAIEEVALLDLLAKEENPSLEIDPYARYKRGKNIGLVHMVSGCIIFGSMTIFLISMFLPSSDKYIDMVKKGTNDNYPNTTYEEAFDEFFANPEWSHFTSEDGEEIIEFTGKFTYMEAEADALFQFMLDLDEGTFSLEYFAINDEPQTVLMAGIVLDKVFSSAEGVDEGDVSNNIVKVAIDDYLIDYTPASKLAGDLQSAGVSIANNNGMYVSDDGCLTVHDTDEDGMVACKIYISQDANASTEYSIYDIYCGMTKESAIVTLENHDGCEYMYNEDQTAVQCYIEGYHLIYIEFENSEVSRIVFYYYN